MITFSDEIKRRLSSTEVAEYYGFSPSSSGSICCPFHGEKTPSLKLYGEGRGWHCFGCGRGGDVIDFVMQLFQLGFKEAVEKINQDFSLGLPVGKQMTAGQRKELNRRMFEHQKKVQEKKSIAEKAEEIYWMAFDQLKYYSDNLDNHRPKTAEDPLNPLFLEALENIGRAKYELSCAEVQRTWAKARIKGE